MWFIIFWNWFVGRIETCLENQARESLEGYKQKLMGYSDRKLRRPKCLCE
jgi:hypothetical protein